MNLLFFHRLDLVHLYAPVSTELSKEYKIIHVAYSNKEVDILRNLYKVAGKIYNISNLRDQFYDSLSINDEKIVELDEFIISNTQERFCLNSSIYLDRTYNNLSYQESIYISLVYYNVWKHIFKESEPDIFFHEPPALMMTHLAAMFCKKSNAKYLTQIQVAGIDKFQWIFLEGDAANFLEYHISNRTSKQALTLDKAEAFIKKSNEDLDVLLNDVVGKQSEGKHFKFYFLIRGILGSTRRALKSKFSKRNKINPTQHIDQFLIRNKKKFIVEIENLYGRLFGSYYSIPNGEDKYYFYPLHLEPEAVVLYYAEGWYEGQMKLIENIAAQLPPNTYLYVKDHPHGGNYRDVKDYKRLLRIRNVKIIDPRIPGKQLIKNSLGVITINGTAGFEGLLMNKNVFCFGKAFYTDFKGVTYISHVKQLRKEIYRANYTLNSFDIKDIQLFLDNSHSGFISYFSDRHNRLEIDLAENILLVVQGIKKLINKIEQDIENIK
jgi:hypothetical protein